MRGVYVVLGWKVIKGLKVINNQELGIREGVGCVGLKSYKE